MRQTQTLRYGALSLIVAALLYLIAEAVAAHAWKTPPYSYWANWISDLGVPTPTTFLGHEINSPLYWIMNTGFVLKGALFFLGTTLITASTRWASDWAYIALAAAYMLGMILIGLFPETMGPIHFLGAQLAIGGSNLAIIAGGRSSIRQLLPHWLPALSMTLGMVGLTFLVILNIIGEVDRSLFEVVGVGFIERLSVYPIVAWTLLTGTLLLRSAGDRQERIHRLR